MNLLDRSLPAGLRRRIATRAMSSESAIIDIGSNTVRLVIYGGPARAPVVVFNEKVSARLGRGLAETGLLSEKAQAAALAALARFAAIVRLRKVRDVTSVATAAVRDATNGADFLAEVAATGLEPRLLSGEEEALASSCGVLGAFPGARGVVADLGGGSLELAHVADGACEHGTSLPLGTLRLPALRAQAAGRFNANVSKLVRKTGWSCEPGETLYLVGGSHRALARVAMTMLDWPIDDPHAFELSPAELTRICQSVAAGKLPPAVTGLASSRVPALPDTAALLAAVVVVVKPARVVFSSWGLREGLAFQRLGAAQRAQDPLIAGVMAFAGRLSAGGESGEAASVGAMVAGWTAGALPASGTSREHLRLAATVLSLALQLAEPNRRGELALDWALHKRWIGIDAEGRAMLAACMLANTGRPALPEALVRLASAEALSEALAWGQAIRLCRRLSGVSVKALSGSALTVEDCRLTLSLDEDWSMLATDTILKDLRALADRLDLEPVVRAR